MYFELIKSQINIMMAFTSVQIPWGELQGRGYVSSSQNGLKNAFHDKSNKVSLSQIIRAISPQIQSRRRLEEFEKRKLFHSVMGSKQIITIEHRKSLETSNSTTPHSRMRLNLSQGMHPFNIQSKSIVMQHPKNLKKPRRRKLEMGGSFSLNKGRSQLEGEKYFEQNKEMNVSNSNTQLLPKYTEDRFFMKKSSAIKLHQLVEPLRRIPTQQNYFTQFTQTPIKLKVVDLNRVSGNTWSIYDCLSKKILFTHNGNSSQVLILKDDRKQQVLQRQQLSRSHITYSLIIKYQLIVQYEFPLRLPTEAVPPQGQDTVKILYNEKDELVTLLDLFYGILLPSGNDAAQCLAETSMAIQKGLMETPFDVDSYLKQTFMTRQSLMNEFYKMMNDLASGMTGTNFCTCDGLSNPLNKSTSCPIVRKCQSLLKMIVGSRVYKCQGTIQNTTRTIEWHNTNKLLSQRTSEYYGLKTGITNTAGPCLAASLKVKSRDFVIVVLRSSSSKQRYKDVILLAQHLLNNI